MIQSASDGCSAVWKPLNKVPDHQPGRSVPLKLDLKSCGALNAVPMFSCRDFGE